MQTFYLIIFDFVEFFVLFVQEIPSNGIDQWFPLQARSAKSTTHGECHLVIRLVGLEVKLITSARRLCNHLGLYVCMYVCVFVSEHDNSKNNTHFAHTFAIA